MKVIKKTVIALLAMSGLAQAQQITGAGASFPAPVYQNWTYNFSQQNPDIKVSYQSLGSGAGVNQIKAGTVDFAGTDDPLSAAQQEEAGLVQVPMLTGGVVIITKLPGVKDGELKLSREVLAGIFLGSITSWADPAIAAINPGLKLPKMKITVVRRSDASGTSFIFTNYLSKISPEWKEKVGQGKSVSWPVGIGGQKNPGVCNNVAKINGSIGYTEYTYAVEAKLACAALENADGVYVKPSAEGFAASAASADWDKAEGFVMELTNVSGAKSWPITGITYVLIRKDAAADKRAAMKKYFTWCLSKGAAAATQLHYVPLPQNVVELIEPNL